MKIELTQGCICDGFYADDERIIDMSIEELKDIFTQLTDYVKGLPLEDKKFALYEAIYNIIELFAQHETSDEPCECCGDFIETYTLEI